jgi:predicted ATPase
MKLLDLNSLLCSRLTMVCFLTHDIQVREAAYDMINLVDKSKFHFDVGMALLPSIESQPNTMGDVLPAVLEQINHGSPLLCNDSERTSIAKLNFEAASYAMQSYNFTAAYQLSKTAVSFLRDDSWTADFDVSLNSHLLLSKAACSCNNLNEAKV